MNALEKNLLVKLCQAEKKKHFKNFNPQGFVMDTHFEMDKSKKDNMARYLKKRRELEEQGIVIELGKFMPSNTDSRSQFAKEDEIVMKIERLQYSDNITLATKGSNEIYYFDEVKFKEAVDDTEYLQPFDRRLLMKAIYFGYSLQKKSIIGGLSPYNYLSFLSISLNLNARIMRYLKKVNRKRYTSCVTKNKIDPRELALGYYFNNCTTNSAKTYKVSHVVEDIPTFVGSAGDVNDILDNLEKYFKENETDQLQKQLQLII